MIFSSPKTKFLVRNKVFKSCKKTNFGFKNIPPFAFLNQKSYLKTDFCSLI